MKTWSVRGVTAILAVVLLVHGVRAAELGFPENCVELAGMSPRGLQAPTVSTRDSVLFSMHYPNRKLNPGEIPPFITWNTRTGKWLAQRPAPDPPVGGWKFSPDGTLLAVPIIDNKRVVQLWEVGPKDRDGVPALRLLTKLLQRYHRPKHPTNEGHAAFADVIPLAWTPDSKTLLALYKNTNKEIQFWSRTDKPSVWDKSDHETKWKPWAILEFERQADLDFAVSPDNQSLAVITSIGAQQGIGRIHDLDTAELREEFQVKRPPRKPYELFNYSLQYSNDSKTLAIGDRSYLALWDTAPLAPRVVMVNPDFLGDYGHPQSQIAFLRDNRWLLAVKTAPHEDRKRLTGGLIQLQFRDAHSGELRREVAFPKELGLLQRLEALPDGRVMTQFVFRNKNLELDQRYFLWQSEDLLRYAAEHGSAPSPTPKVN